MELSSEKNLIIFKLTLIIKLELEVKIFVCIYLQQNYKITSFVFPYTINNFDILKSRASEF